jgi:Doubled CXXCH motif (Paired_CXXCH_1)
VLGTNTNASPTQGRSAGAVNDPALGAPYEHWKGHTLGSTAVPPGFDPTRIGAPATWYDPTGGLECISCHSQHGQPTAYRNLGSFALGGAAGNARPTYVIGTTNDTTKDVWVNIAAPYTPNSGSAATFNPYYDTANVSYNRNDATVGVTKTSNRMDTFCASCHGNFHGGPGDTDIGASVAALDGFIRHPTSQTTIGAAGAQGFGGHTALSRYTAATTKLKVYASDRVGYSDATPGCISCHKAHGNQNPFGLVFLHRTAAAVGEQGGYATGQTEVANGYQVGYRNMCGQCHSQGN